MEMPFRVMSRVGPSNHVLDRVKLLHGYGQILEAENAAVQCIVQAECDISALQKSEPIKLPFVVVSRVGWAQRNVCIR